MDKFFKFLDGKKSYITAILLAAGTIGGYLHGDLNAMQAFYGVMSAFGLGSIKSAISKAEI